MKIRLFIAILLLLQTVYMGSAQSLDSEIISHIKESTVYIEVVHSFPFQDKDITTSGSGFIISEAGLVATNYHVVQPFFTVYGMNFPAPVKSIEITKNSGTPQYKKYIGYVFAADKTNDLALLRITGEKKFSYLSLPDTAKLIETMPVWVFGFPYGDEFSVINTGPGISVNQGSISALRNDDRGLLKTIQVDVPVNPGNSGGPLVNKNGELTGIINSTYSSNKMSFAIPIRYLKTICSDFLKQEIADSVECEIVTEPAGATVFTDWKKAGVTPLKTKLKTGLHTLCLMKQGFVTRIEESTYASDTKKKYEMQAVRNIRVSAGKKDEDKTLRVMLPAEITDMMINKNLSDEKNYLLKEDFDSQADFEKWKQNTGGNDKRTWFIEDGILKQFDSDELLHAISLGDSTWENYYVKAKVKITDSHDDSRAGIIFRETSDGFYLFRIHKESKKAQLAYHSNHPFGWFVICEKNTGIDITDRWYNMSVCITGNLITCYLDTSLIFSTYAEYSTRGNVGLYSVQSKAWFDSLLVCPVSFIPSGSDNYGKKIQSFWFSDYFDLKSDSWFQYSDKNISDASWTFSDGGCLIKNTGDKEITNEFTKFSFDDFNARINVTLDNRNDTSSLSIFFRKSDSGKTEIKFSGADNKVRLLLHKNAETKTLKEENLPEDFFGDFHVLILLAEKGEISISSQYKTLLEYRNKSLVSEPGTVGFSAKAITLALHEMTISSINDEKGEKGNKR